ncbi:VanZ family protein [Myroides injenensis]|uniref:VanZ family protein n=1 Tax=Myroides injenensis TaxID=1183151 RepID=UPI00028971E0|nr:VanZ family protein [Myroides injenensis]
MARKFIFTIGIFWTILIVIACLVEGSSVPKISVFNIPNKDKIAHFTFYFVFSIIWFLYIVKSRLKISRIKLTFAIFTIVCLLGGSIEILQYYTTTSRSAEWADFFANCLGSIIGLLLCMTLTKNKK